MFITTFPIFEMKQKNLLLEVFGDYSKNYINTTHESKLLHIPKTTIRFEADDNLIFEAFYQTGIDQPNIFLLFFSFLLKITHLLLNLGYKLHLSLFITLETARILVKSPYLWISLDLGHFLCKSCKWL